MLQIFASNGDEIGKVTKQWSGLVKEVFTDTDNFGITCEFVYVECKSGVVVTLMTPG